MARSARSSHSQDLIGRISNTIADHPRVSAAAAFQMGVLLGQAMQNAGALKDIGRKMAAAPAALASSIPTFGLFDSAAPKKSRSARSKAATKPSAAARSRGAAKRSKRA
ncbi:MAG: hypothetical protein ACOY5F_01490 [Pseudomonadota bacterium]|jgi:hypothetical protein